MFKCSNYKIFKCSNYQIITNVQKNNSLLKKVLSYFLDFLKQGVTPEKLILTVVLGFLIGILPIVGATTVLCTLVALRLRLNMAVIQSVNYFAYPVQLILLIPFMKIGQALFGLHLISFSISDLLQMFRADWLLAVRKLWFAYLLGGVAWLIIAVPLGVMLYFSLLKALKLVALRNVKQLENVEVVEN